MNHRILSRLKPMPPMLRTVWVLFAFSGPLLFASTVSPWCQWTRDDRPVGYAEFWASGAGVLMVAVSVTMMLVAVGIFRAQRWIQLAIPTGFVIAALGGIMHAAPVEGAGCLAWAAFSYWYLNRKETTRHYFTPTASRSADSASGQ